MRICYMVSIILAFCLNGYCGTEWIETTQNDFSSGAYECNLYASMQDNGTVEFTSRWDLNNDGYIDIVVSNEFGSYSFVYWGSAQGFSPNVFTSYPGNAKGDWEAGDINNDGYTELLSAQGDCPYRIRIFKGTSNGPSPSTYTDILLNDWNESCYLADLNKDGYVDLAVNKYEGGSGAIFWGSASGFSTGNKILLPSTAGEHNIEAADFNKDGFPDLLFIREENNTKSYVYWGSSDGFDPNSHATLQNPPGLPSGSSVADLDNDGYLEIVLTCFCGGSASYIYKYTGTAFVLWQTLQAGSCFGGSAIADFNNDGFQDILYTRGYGYDLYPVIYWGSAAGYSEYSKTNIGVPVDASGALVTDFNSDGILDIFVNNYAYPPEPSYFLMGPDYATPTTFLPTIRDAHGFFREIGNVYNRQYYEDYVSSVFDASCVTDWGIVSWDAVTPLNSDVQFWLRSGNTPTPDQTWFNWTSIANNGIIPDFLNSRYLQYKARLLYTDAAGLPSLQEVRVSYGSTVIPVTLRIEPEVINLKSHGLFTAFITLPVGQDPSQIDPFSILCEGASPVKWEANAVCFIAKFRVKELVGVEPGPAVVFEVTGKTYAGNDFIGSDTVKVINTDAITIMCNPNPLKKSATIYISSSGVSPVDAKIYNVNGQLVRNLRNMATSGGQSSVNWDRRDISGRIVPAGTYFYQVKCGKETHTTKIMVID